MREKAITDILDNIQNLPDAVKANMLTEIAKNIDKLPPEMKQIKNYLLSLSFLKNVFIKCS